MILWTQYPVQQNRTVLLTDISHQASTNSSVYQGEGIGGVVDKDVIGVSFVWESDVVSKVVIANKTKILEKLSERVEDKCISWICLLFPENKGNIIFLLSLLCLYLY